MTSLEADLGGHLCFKTIWKVNEVDIPILVEIGPVVWEWEGNERTDERTDERT